MLERQADTPPSHERVSLLMAMAEICDRFVTANIRGAKHHRLSIGDVQSLFVMGLLGGDAGNVSAIIVEVRVDTSTYLGLGLRATGSTDNWYGSRSAWRSSKHQQTVKLDANDEFEAQRSSGTVGKTALVKHGGQSAGSLCAV